MFGDEDEQNRVSMLNHIEENFPKLTTLLYTINLKGNDSLYGLAPQIHYGKGFVIERLGDFQFKDRAKIIFSNQFKTR